MSRWRTAAPEPECGRRQPAAAGHYTRARSALARPPRRPGARGADAHRGEEQRDVGTPHLDLAIRGRALLVRHFAFAAPARTARTSLYPPARSRTAGACSGVSGLGNRSPLPAAAAAGGVGGVGGALVFCLDTGSRLSRARTSMRDRSGGEFFFPERKLICGRLERATERDDDSLPFGAARDN